MYNPVSTIRLQFNKDFTFQKFEELIPFFVDLGVKTIYASPIFKATPGSLHGYDVTDPLSINPEIGTEEDLVRISKRLLEKGIGWIQDIVPNHMAFHHENGWLNDVLEKGPGSEYAEFFDTTWSGDFFHEPIMVPFLGSSLRETIEAGDLKIVDSRLQYFDHSFPLNKQSKEFLSQVHDPDADQVEHVANLQFYRLCSYKETNKKINYRRFFLINGLICLNIQSKAVFDTYHELIAKLVNTGTFKGLRIDHIDGLYDPKEYLRRLRDLVGPETYIVVEKILEPEEELDRSWPIQGTTGYEFIAAVNNLFTNTGSRRVFDQVYQIISPGKKSFDDRIIDSKRLILRQYMSAELDNLTLYFNDLGLNKEKLGYDTIRSGIEEALVRCPYYRFYDETSANAELELLDKSANKTAARKFYMRLMQFTGPLMAKGVEDTLMYTFNRFIAHNEVGDLPDQFGDRITTFHEIMTKRLQEWPLALNATASHDTKRGEDSRMRLNVLTDIPDEWNNIVRKWISLNAEYTGTSEIDANDEYMIYQALIASFEGSVTREYIERLTAYISKALREAKVHSKWESPNEHYEHSVISFVKKILSEESEFMKTFLPFVKKVAEHGKLNSHVQLALKITCPGVPDIYQGSLHWDLSFVDPDNRRPVDYNIQGDKIQLIKKLLNFRKDHEKIFTVGNYHPLKVNGLLRSNVIAFAREYQGTWIIVAAMLHSAQLLNKDRINLAEIDWKNTTIQLPEGLSETGEINVSGLFSEEPVAILKFEVPKRERRAGILMPITSLPSSFGIGDVGLSARQFADFLFKGRQRAWQVLPVNAVDEASFFSPYSPTSSVAGNKMLISLDDLVYDGLLTPDDTRSVKKRNKTVVDYTASDQEKTLLLRKAWENFKKKKSTALQLEFEEFRDNESSWLDGFAQFSLLQGIYNNRPWTEWPGELRDRHEKALRSLEEQHSDELTMIRWIQFIFFRQMRTLKSYCNERDIILIGDIPFYICLNSADVWQYKNVFDISESGNVNNMAGVPPDYFNSDGQVWGMPIFNWEKETDAAFQWWIQRLEKNFKLFDYIRLDHFRAFADYWSIPAGSKNAKTGTWEKGPGLRLFETLRKTLGNLRLVAEDLGEISDDVYDLRDTLKLPGMKVLQFGFGSDFPSSIHLPHNHSDRFIVYPGTHDNNTTRGWFENEVGPSEVNRLQSYFNTKVTKRNISDLFIRSCYQSPAQTAIVAMQDILDLDQTTRINKPATTSGNWTWRLKELPKTEVIGRLRNLVFLYER